MSALFLYLHNPDVYFAITQAHGQVGYHICKYGSLEINPALSDRAESMMYSEGRLVDYSRLSDVDFGAPTKPFPINDTVGYGVLLGLIWSVTGSFSFADVQWLQALLFVLLMPLYYKLAFMFFNCRKIALLCSIAHIFFLPLLAYAVMPVRDIWAYYGFLVFAYMLCAALYDTVSNKSLVVGVLFFVGCVWIRPTLFFTLVLCSLFACYAARVNNRKRVRDVLMCFWAATLLLFWLPHAWYNYTHYHRFFVGPAGQSMLEGLGEIENPWGHRLNDEYVATFIEEKYGLAYGTPEFDEAAMREFRMHVQENPWHFLKTLILRVPDAILPGLQWIFYTTSPYAHCSSIKQKLIFACSSFRRVLLFLLRQVYMRVYILLAWFGMMVLWRRKKYTIFWFVVAGICSGLTTFPSHIEYRYLVPFYWVFSLPFGFVVSCFLSVFKHNVRTIDTILNNKGRR
jgi:hypothetical protein